MARVLMAAALAAICLGPVACAEKPEAPAAPTGQPDRTAEPGDVQPEGAGGAPPTDPFATVPDVTDEGGDSIEAKLRAAGNFATLSKALVKTEAIYNLEPGKAYTLIAPNDEAFEALPAEKLEALNKDLPAYRKLLLGHVIAGRMTAAELADAGSVETVAGTTLTFTKQGDAVLVDGRPLILEDLQAGDSLIDSVGRVLEPAK